MEIGAGDEHGEQEEIDAVSRVIYPRPRILDKGALIDNIDTIPIRGGKAVTLSQRAQTFSIRLHLRLVCIVKDVLQLKDDLLPVIGQIRCHGREV